MAFDRCETGAVLRTTAEWVTRIKGRLVHNPENTHLSTQPSNKNKVSRGGACYQCSSSVRRHAFFLKKRECSFFKNDTTVEWLNKAQNIISFLMNSDCIACLFCVYFWAGDCIVSSGPGLSSLVCLPAVQAPLETLWEIQVLRPTPQWNQTAFYWDPLWSVCMWEWGIHESRRFLFLLHLGMGVVKTSCPA